MGASRIVGRDMHEGKFTAAKSAGAHDVECVFGGTPEECFDVVVDTTGNDKAISESFSRVDGGGTFVMVGQPKPRESVTIKSARHMFDGEGKTIKATQGGGFRPEKDIPRYLALWRSGILKLDGIISHRIPLDRINEGIDLVRNGQAGRIMVEMV